MTIDLYGQSYVGGAWMMNAGYMHAPAISSSLSSITNYSIGFHKGYTIIGTEFNYRNDKAIMVISGYMGTPETIFLDDDDKEVGSFLWKAHGGFGWTVYRKKAVVIYPVMGAGVIQSSLIDRTINGSEKRSSKISPSIEAGINFDYIIKQDRHGNGYFNAALLSMRAGYTSSLSPQLRGWTITVCLGGVAFLKDKVRS